MSQQLIAVESLLRGSDQRQQSCTAKERLIGILVLIIAVVFIVFIWCLYDVIKSTVTQERLPSEEGVVVCLSCSDVTDDQEYFTHLLEGEIFCCRKRGHLKKHQTKISRHPITNSPSAEDQKSEENDFGATGMPELQKTLSKRSKDGILLNLNSKTRFHSFRDGLHLLSGWMYNLTNQAFRKGSISLDQSLTSVIIPYESVYLISYEIVIRCASAMSDSSGRSHTVSHALLRFRGASNTPKDSTTLRESAVLLGPSQLYVKCFSLQLAMPLKLFKGDRLALAMSVPDLLVKENNAHFFSVYDLGW